MGHRSLIALVTLVFGILTVACAQEDDSNLLEKSQGSGAAQGKTDSPNSAASCAKSCEGTSEDGSCWCDSGCDLIGDCCADYADYCETQSAGGASAGGTSAGGGKGGTGGTGGATGGKGGTGGTGNAAGTGGKGGTGGVGGVGGYGGTGVGGSTSNPSSCIGHCGGMAASGVCYCDQSCQLNGDCCPDFASACGGTTTGSGCTPQLCQSGGQGTENGAPCYCDTMCMAYGDCCMNVLQVCGF